MTNSLRCAQPVDGERHPGLLETEVGRQRQIVFLGESERLVHRLDRGVEVVGLDQPGRSAGAVGPGESPPGVGQRPPGGTSAARGSIAPAWFSSWLTVLRRLCCVLERVGWKRQSLKSAKRRSRGRNGRGVRVWRRKRVRLSGVASVRASSRSTDSPRDLMGANGPRGDHRKSRSIVRCQISVPRPCACEINARTPCQ